MRTLLARAIGLGSAKEGVQIWWTERVTAVALVPLTLWFIGSLITHSGADYAHFVAWLRKPLTASLMVLMMIALFYHAALGLWVIIEDYIHSTLKLATVIVTRLVCFALAVTGIMATLRVALGVR